jgi:hypothetical protein
MNKHNKLVEEIGRASHPQGKKDNDIRSPVVKILHAIIILAIILVCAGIMLFIGNFVLLQAIKLLTLLGLF